MTRGRECQTSHVQRSTLTARKTGPQKGRASEGNFGKELEWLSGHLSSRQMALGGGLWTGMG